LVMVGGTTTPCDCFLSYIDPTEPYYHTFSDDPLGFHQTLCLLCPNWEACRHAKALIWRVAATLYQQEPISNYIFDIVKREEVIEGRIVKYIIVSVQTEWGHYNCNAPMLTEY
jgi:hypothetical protein